MEASLHRRHVKSIFWIADIKNNFRCIDPPTTTCLHISVPHVRIFVLNKTEFIWIWFIGDQLCLPLQELSEVTLKKYHSRLVLWPQTAVQKCETICDVSHCAPSALFPDFPLFAVSLVWSSHTQSSDFTRSEINRGRRRISLFLFGLQEKSDVLL